MRIDELRNFWHSGAWVHRIGLQGKHGEAGSWTCHRRGIRQRPPLHGRRWYEEGVTTSGTVGMSHDAVHAVLDALAAAGCRAWVAGGWGVDALVGRQTRRHRDLDLAIDARAEDAAMRALAEHGYAVETDWRPVRVELAAPGERWVDLHPVLLDEHGNGTQHDLDGGVFTYPSDCFVTGTIAGRTVGCLSVGQQLIFHSGYEPRDVDLADIALLRALQ